MRCRCWVSEPNFRICRAVKLVSYAMLLCVVSAGGRLVLFTFDRSVLPSCNRTAGDQLAVCRKDVTATATADHWFFFHLRVFTVMTV